MSDELADIYRREVGRCTATLIRVLGDIDLAEDAVAEALRAGRIAEAVVAYDVAIALAPNPVAKQFLTEQRDRAARSGSRDTTP